MIGLRKPSLVVLLNEYLDLVAEAEAYRAAFDKIPPSETVTRRKIAKDLLHKYAKVDEALLKIISRFSPMVAKELDFKLKNHMTVAEGSLNKDYRNLPELKNAPDWVIEDLTNSGIDTSIMYSELIYQIASIVFIAVMEGMKRTRGKPPLELDEYLKTILQKKDKKYAKLYEGAWQALESENPDKFRQFAVSNRELVRSLIGEKSPQRRARLASILKSDTGVELVESLADTLDRVHEVLSKGVHREIDYETALLSLRITEHVLRFIFVREDLEFTKH